MIIRDYYPSDIESLRKIHKQDFPFPDPTNLLFLSKKTIVNDENKIIGAGFVRLTSECILIMDESLPKLTRIKSVLNLAESLRRDVQLHGLDECHAFVRSSKIANLLYWFGFRESKGGKALVINL